MCWDRLYLYSALILKQQYYKMYNINRATQGYFIVYFAKSDILCTLSL